MLQIGNTAVSLEVLRAKFKCDLGACRGSCCVEGDAGAPVTLEEVEKLEAVLPMVWDDLSAQARAVIRRQGVVYSDCQGELVTSIVGGKDCVFTTYGGGGCCYCAIEKAFRAGKTDFCKPISCRLYPVRVSDYGTYQAVNYHRWDICKAGELLGRREDMPLYRFLREPLTARFGEAWYEELDTAAREMQKQGLL